eukprot:363156-Rhodomonas_salina.3
MMTIAWWLDIHGFHGVAKVIWLVATVIHVSLLGLFFRFFAAGDWDPVQSSPQLDSTRPGGLSTIATMTEFLLCTGDADVDDSCRWYLHGRGDRGSDWHGLVGVGFLLVWFHRLPYPLPHLPLPFPRLPHADPGAHPGVLSFPSAHLLRDAWPSHGAAPADVRGAGGAGSATPHFVDRHGRASRA